MLLLRCEVEEEDLGGRRWCGWWACWWLPWMLLGSVDEVLEDGLRERRREVGGGGREGRERESMV